MLMIIESKSDVHHSNTLQDKIRKQSFEQIGWSTLDLVCKWVLKPGQQKRAREKESVFVGEGQESSQLMNKEKLVTKGFLKLLNNRGWPITTMKISCLELVFVSLNHLWNNNWVSLNLIYYINYLPLVDYNSYSFEYMYKVNHKSVLLTCWNSANTNCKN